MKPLENPLTRDALEIWHAGVQAVSSERVVHHAIEVTDDGFYVEETFYKVASDARVIVIGAGKASLGMLDGLVHAFRDTWLEDRLVGWINLPGIAPLVSPHENIVVHPSRPFGSNLPTTAAVFGTQQICKLVQSASPDDIVLCLLSGGGSSLLVEPIAGMTLEQKSRLTQELSLAGADIHQLNTVRRAVSMVKGGGLLRRCSTNQVATLVISDVLDDDLATIASGPTYEHAQPNYDEAVRVIERILPPESLVADHVVNLLRQKAGARQQELTKLPSQRDTYILANNAMAVDAAGTKAVELGYSYIMHCHRKSEGDVEHVSQQMLHAFRALCHSEQQNCVIMGGEPTVDLSCATSSDNRTGLGGRNQHLVLLTAVELLSSHLDLAPFQFCLLSAGTDGEDGNSTSAGAWIDDHSIRTIDLEHSVDALKQFNSHHYLKQLGTTIETGLTGTNVCDLRVLLVRQKQSKRGDQV